MDPKGMSLSDLVAEHMFDRFTELGIISKPPLQVQIPGKKQPASTPDVDLTANIQKEIMDEAVANQKYYLDLAAKDGKPWFQHPKKSYQYPEFVLCTPDMAQELMVHNINNRKVGQSDVDSQARDMKARRWMQTEESLGIDTHGNFYQGQHRALAVIQAGVAVPLNFTFQALPQARFYVDSGRRRATNGKLEMIMGRANANKTITATCRSMMVPFSRTNYKMSDSEIAAFLVKYQDTINWACKILGAVRADVIAAFAKASLWYGREEIEPIADRFHTVVFKRVDDPANALYKWLHQQRKYSVSGAEVYYKTAYAIQAVMEGVPVKKLRGAKADFFEWKQPNWDVPDSAPVHRV